MTRAYALIDWLMPPVVAVAVTWLLWADVLAGAPRIGEKLTLIGYIALPMAAAYWCGREHGGRRRG